MKTIEIIRGAMSRRADTTVEGVGTPAWWTQLATELEAEGAEMVKKKKLAQFAARFTGQAILVDAQSANGREVASFELRMEGSTKNVACLALNEAALRQM